MNKFKIGDEVERIQGVGDTSVWLVHLKETLAPYIITNIKGEFIEINNFKPLGSKPPTLSHENFDLVTPVAKIDLTKQYKIKGETKGKVVTPYEVVGDCLHCKVTCNDGLIYVDQIEICKLEELSKYHDWKVDDKVVVKTGDFIINCYFAGLAADGTPMIFQNGRTSYSCAGHKELMESHWTIELYKGE